MNRVFTVLGAIFLAQLMFVGMVHVFLRVQGKDSPETMEALHGLPVVGGFFPQSAPVEPSLSPEEAAKREARLALIETTDFFPLPPSYDREEIEALCRAARDAQTRHEQALLDLQRERESLKAATSEYETEQTGLMSAAAELEDRARDLQAGMEELTERSNRLDQDKIANLRSISEMYENMPPDSAAKQLTELDVDLTARILHMMSQRKSGKILAVMEVPEAVAVTRRIQAITSSFGEGAAKADTPDRDGR